jgi:hypothetical protein
MRSTCVNRTRQLQELDASTSPTAYQICDPSRRQRAAFHELGNLGPLWSARKLELVTRVNKAGEGGPKVN